MKKIALACAAAMALVFTSCGEQNKTAKLESDMDSLSYALGVMQASQLKPQLDQQFQIEGLDSTYYEEFMKGFKEAVKSKDDKNKLAYIYGMMVGNMVNGRNKQFNKQLFDEDSTMLLNEKLIALAFQCEFLASNETLPNDSAIQFLNNRADQIGEDYQAKKYEEAKQKNDDYMAQVAKKQGVKALSDGVYYEVIEEGNGVIPADTVQISVHYEGQLIDGKKFDSSYEREQPMELTKADAHLVPGFTAALNAMPYGAKWKVYIPWEQAYGKSGNRNPYTGEVTIAPYSTLIFTVELVDPAKAEKE